MKHATSLRWRNLWHALGASGDPMPTFRLIASAYAEPHRFYHDRLHLDECLTEFDSARALAADPLAIEAALWFHDVVYDPSAPGNETESAALAARAFNHAGVSRKLTTRVCALILETETHAPKPNTDAALLVDIDLAIFGQSTARFAEYETAIREEYFWVKPAIYRSKRSEILARFLDRPFIYSTDCFRLKYEVAARQNLTLSRQQLEYSPC